MKPELLLKDYREVTIKLMEGVVELIKQMLLADQFSVCMFCTYFQTVQLQSRVVYI